MNPAGIPLELIYDSAEKLRRADQIIEDLRAGDAAPTLAQRLDTDSLVPPLPEILHRAYSEIVHVVENLGRSRAILEQAAVDRVHRTNAKLREVTSTTELATTGILDNLESGLGLLDEMDADATRGAPGAEKRTQLRDILHGILAQLQFQDITSQQLNYATSLLDDLEERLRAIVGLIDASVFGIAAPVHTTQLADVQAQHFDPAATAADACARQALADQIFS